MLASKYWRGARVGLLLLFPAAVVVAVPQVASARTFTVAALVTPVRGGPGFNYQQTGKLYLGARVPIDCQAWGSPYSGSEIWDRYPGEYNFDWIEDSALAGTDHGQFTYGLPRCPYRSSGAAPLWGEPRPGAAMTGWMPELAFLSITCQEYGLTDSGSTIWDHISGSASFWVSNNAVQGTRVGALTPGIPRCFNATVPSYLEGRNTYANAANADVALRYLNRWGGQACADTGKPSEFGGQCKQFVNCVVWLASRGTVWLGGGYQAPFIVAGGVLIPLDQAMRGDIIQLVGPDPNVSYAGIHTAIVVGYLTAGSYEVVDSNFRSAKDSPGETVHEHQWNPEEVAKEYGLSVQVWRLARV